MCLCVCRDCAVCIVKPHASASLPGIVSALSESGLAVTAARSLQFTRGTAEDYLEVYRGLVDEAARCVCVCVLPM